MDDSEQTLRNIFTYYASFGEPLNHDKLKASRLVKLFQDADLLKDKQPTHKIVIQQESRRTHMNKMSSV